MPKYWRITSTVELFNNSAQVQSVSRTDRRAINMRYGSTGHTSAFVSRFIQYKTGVMDFTLSCERIRSFLLLEERIHRGLRILKGMRVLTRGGCCCKGWFWAGFWNIMPLSASWPTCLSTPCEGGMVYGGLTIPPGPTCNQSCNPGDDGDLFLIERCRWPQSYKAMPPTKVK